MILYRTTDGLFVEVRGRFTHIEEDWDALFNRRGLAAFLGRGAAVGGSTRRLPASARILPPIASQEV